MTMGPQTGREEMLNSGNLKGPRTRASEECHGSCRNPPFLLHHAELAAPRHDNHQAFGGRDGGERRDQGRHQGPLVLKLYPGFPEKLLQRSHGGSNGIEARPQAAFQRAGSSVPPCR